MAKHNGRVLVKMLSTESHHIYWTQKNKRSNGERLELRKFDPTVNRHVVYREAR